MAAGTRWTCPECGREFGAVGRGHICQPGLTMNEFLDGEVPAPVAVAGAAGGTGDGWAVSGDPMVPDDIDDDLL